MIINETRYFSGFYLWYDFTKVSQKKMSSEISKALRYFALCRLQNTNITSLNRD